MIQGLLGQKIGMKQVFDREGKILPVTILKIPENVAVQIKTEDKDGYRAVQLGMGKKKRISKPMAGHLKKAGISGTVRILVEVGVEGSDEIALGKSFKVEEVFSEGELIKVTGTSKGRGFSGAVKRWGFATQPKTHGQSDRERAPGSIGAQTPGRVFKGKKMPGHFGSEKKSVKNLLLVKIDPEKQEVWVKGAVPGPQKGFVVLTKSGKNKKFAGLEEDSINEEKDRKENK